MAQINIYTQQITVGQDDIDMQHRVSNLRYVAWMQDVVHSPFCKRRMWRLRIPLFAVGPWSGMKASGKAGWCASTPSRTSARPFWVM